MTALVDLGSTSSEDLERFVDSLPPGCLVVDTKVTRAGAIIQNVDIEDVKGGRIGRSIPDPLDLDFKKEFAYKGVKPDQMKTILGKIKLDFGGSIEYDIYLKRSAI